MLQPQVQEVWLWTQMWDRGQRSEEPAILRSGDHTLEPEFIWLSHDMTAPAEG